MDGASFVTVATLQLSAVIGAPKSKPVTTQVAPALTVISAGGVIVGFILSSIVTTTDEKRTLSPVSVAITKTVLGPTSLQVKELGIVNKVYVQLSVVPSSIMDGFNETVPLLSSSNVISFTLITGAILS